MIEIRLQNEPFDHGAEVNRFAAQVEGAGAVVTFAGVVRGEGGRMSSMEIEHYPGMTEKALTGFAEEAAARWGLAGALVIHRHGRLAVGETIMMVATAAPHRADAFAAAEYLMDYLKSRAPFWKKEIAAGEVGGSAWVDAKESDEAALDRW